MSRENPKIVIIGAGSAQFGYSTLGDIFQSTALRDRRTDIVLHDINSVTLKQVARTAQDFIEAHALPFTLSASLSRRQALHGADFCIISIEIGDRFVLWEQDWRIPQQFGMRQVYGENGGPGGFFHALRIIPPMLQICEDISQICPQATVFNFSNPMSRICTAVYRKFPHLHFIGLCHEIASLKKHLPALTGLPYEALQVRAGGLNHFSVLLQAIVKETGENLYPKILRNAPAYFEKLEHTLPTPRNPDQPDAPALTKSTPWHERRLFKLILEKFHLLPITTDSHFGEYPAWTHDVVDHEGILDFYHAYQKYVRLSAPQIELKCSERAIPIIEGVLNDVGFEEGAVNLPNKGFIPDLPAFLAVEVPAIVDGNGIHGISLGEIMPKGFIGLLANQVAIHDLTAETAITGSRDLALQALLVDPIVDKAGAAEKMLECMLELQKDYLGYIE